MELTVQASMATAATRAKAVSFATCILYNKILFLEASTGSEKPLTNSPARSYSSMLQRELFAPSRLGRLTLRLLDSLEQGGGHIALAFQL